MKKGGKKVGGSLTLRIAFLIILFLVVPLIIHSTIIYVRDYRVKTVQAIKFLHLAIQEGQKDFDAYTDDLYREVVLIEELHLRGQVDVNRLASDLRYQSLFFISQEGVCELSSKKELVGKDFSDLVMPLAHQSIRYQVMARLDGRIYFLARIAGQKYVAIELSKERLTKIFLSDHRDTVTYETSLLHKNGRVFMTTLNDLNNKSIVMPSHLAISSDVTLLPLVKVEGYQFELDDTHWLALEAPILGSNILLFLCTNQRLIQHDAIHNLKMAFEMFIFVIVVGGVLAFWGTLRMAKPLKRLVRTMHAVESGVDDARFKEDRFGFEINRIGMIFNRAIDALQARTKEAQEERIEKEKLSKEMILGGDIQRSTLPKDLPDFPELKIAAGFVSAHEMGGDFYDLQVLDEGRFLIVVADAAGKGLSAGLFTLTLRGMLRALAGRCRDLEEYVREVNTIFCQDTKDTGVFVTAWVGIYDRNERSLTYTSAGHLPALLKRDEHIDELIAGGRAFGVDHEEVKLEKCFLQVGDLLVLYTDGITEAMNDNGEMFGKERLKEALEEGSVEHVVSLVLQRAKDFEKGRFQHDDQTVLMIKVVS